MELIIKLHIYLEEVIFLKEKYNHLGLHEKNIPNYYTDIKIHGEQI